MLLGINPRDFRMATWEAGNKRYRVYPNAPADRFRLGIGYWMSLDSSADLSQEGRAAPTVIELPLAWGWNLIGDPYLSGIDFYAIRVREQDGVIYPLNESMARGVLGSGLFGYMLGGYRSVAALTPYVGYWILANEPCSLVIDVTTDALAVSPAAVRPAVPVPADGWLLQLRAKVAGLEDTATYIGTAAGASDGFDAGLDQGKPPAPDMAPYVYVGLQETEAGAMAVDIRGQGGRAQEWDMAVKTNLAGQRVELSWPDLSSLPAGTQPILTDLATGKQVYMRTNRAYVFTADGNDRKLRITTSPDDVGQLAIGSASASAAGGSVAVTYTLSKSAAVTVEVRNISGHLVRRVVTGLNQSAGLQSVTWNGRSASGVLVPGGRYIIAIRARTENGQASRALTQVSIRR